MDDPERTMSDPARQPTVRKSRLRGGPLGWILLYTRGLIVDQHLRRLTMFYLALTALLMVFFGALFLDGWVQASKQDFRLALWFACYWLAVAWLTMAAALLAIYDLLFVRVQHRAVRRQLRQRILGEEPANHDSEP